VLLAATDVSVLLAGSGRCDARAVAIQRLLFIIGVCQGGSCSSQALLSSGTAPQHQDRMILLSTAKNGFID